MGNLDGIEGILLILGSILLKLAPKIKKSWARIWPIDGEKEILSKLTPWIIERKPKLRRGTVLRRNFNSSRWYAYECTDDLFVILITDGKESDKMITDRVRRAGRAVRSALENQSITKVFKNYTEIVTPFLESKLVVALVGTRGVGKTTTMHLLLGQRPPEVYIPTMGMNTERLDGMDISNCTVDLWDLGGDDEVNKVWESCLVNVDVILLLTDSTLKNVLESQKLVSEIMNCAETASLIVIVNKQDLPNALAPSVVEKVFNMEVHPLAAIDLTEHEEAERILKQSLVNHIGFT
ncbi:MAG: ADP-ribosylation factor-like protein [Candidatus Thorarchaeota archaeon]